jgi:structural maintenance of chromosomes protein 5
MSLQSLTRSPFRVVDEINQGMDPRNERLVHARMVSIATGTDEEQFRVRVPTARANGGDADSNDEDEIGDEADDIARADEDGGNRGRGSQYFLITPKLLPGLKYERGMRVLCIASGEHMPADQRVVDFKHCLAIRRGYISAAAS